MTVAATTRRAGPFSGNDSTTSFAFTFKVYAEADLVVTLSSTADVDSDLTLDSDYTVSLNSDQEADPGGSVTYPISGDPLATGEKLTITTADDPAQESDITNAGGFFPQSIEDQLDKIVIFVQQQTEKLSRTFTVAASSVASGLSLGTATERAGKYVKFDDSGDVELTALTANALTQTTWNSFFSSAAETVWSAVFGSWSLTGTAAQALAKLINPKTSAETSAGVSIVDYWYTEGAFDRYGTNTTPGTTDMATAINNAISVMNAKGGGRAYGMGGTTYGIGSTLTLKDYVTLGSDSVSETVIKLLDGSNVDMLKTTNYDTIDGGSTTDQLATGIGFINIVFDGNKSNQTAGNGLLLAESGMYIDNMNIVQVYGHGLRTVGARVVGTNFPTTPYRRIVETHVNRLAVQQSGGIGVDWQGSADAIIQSLVVEESGQQGLVVDGDAYSVQIYYLHAYSNCGDGADAHAVDLNNGTEVHNAEIRDNYEGGINVDSGCVIGRLYAQDNLRTDSLGTGYSVTLSGNAARIGLAKIIAINGVDARLLNVSGNADSIADLYMTGAASVTTALSLTGNRCRINGYIAAMPSGVPPIEHTAGTENDIRLITNGNTDAPTLSSNGRGEIHITDDTSANERHLIGNKQTIKFEKSSISDSTATSVIKITTTDETSNDGGSWTLNVKALVGHGVGPGAGSLAALYIEAAVAHVTDSAGNVADSAVSETVQTATAADASATKDITDVSFSVSAVSAYVREIQVTVTLSGASITTAEISGEAELITYGYSTLPVIEAV